MAPRGKGLASVKSLRPSLVSWHMQVRAQQGGKGAGAGANVGNKFVWLIGASSESLAIPSLQGGFCKWTCILREASGAVYNNCIRNP